VLGTPVMAITMLLVAVERIFGVGIFDPALGGDPVLFQHLFWFYSHPAVYIMILPGMGVISELIACFSRKTHLRLQFVAILQPGHRHARLPRVGPPHVRQRAVDVRGDGLLHAELPRGHPSAIKVFNWTATLYKGSISLETPMLYASASSGCSRSAA
jgi:cytochrome c oxidase subunit I